MTKQKNIINKLLAGIGIIAILALVFLSRSSNAHANLGLQFSSTNDNAFASTTKNFGNALATTTPAYMTAGTATTTIQLYTENTDAIALSIFLNASSTGTILNWRYEYSDNAIDWYSDDFNMNNLAATTTVAVPTFSSYSWTFASSTGGTATATNSLKRVVVPNTGLSRFTRIVFSLAPSSTNGAITVRAARKTANTN